jgi:hypothetical protein
MFLCFMEQTKLVLSEDKSNPGRQVCLSSRAECQAVAGPLKCGSRSLLGVGGVQTGRLAESPTQMRGISPVP